MKTEPQCIEGPEALKNFEHFATAAMQAPKPNLKKHPKAKATSRKSKNHDKD